MRERIYSIVEKAKPGDYVSRVYDWFLLAAAFISIVPLMVKSGNIYLERLDIITVYILFTDYILRWITHDFMVGKPGSIKAFIKYPISGFAILDLLAILPSLGLLGPSFKILRMLRLSKVLHYSKSFVHISRVVHKERRTLSAVLVIALSYIFVSALAMFSYEPETFETFFHALYWATTALTTVGYGDIFPKTMVGQLISMISSLFGIAVIALPAGVVTAGFMDEINRDKQLEVEVIELPGKEVVVVDYIEKSDGNEREYEETACAKAGRRVETEEKSNEQ